MVTLRARQVELARQTIIDACADLVTERHQLDFAMQEVASKAGVSLRTVYNHFETREDLLDALGAAFEQRASELGSRNADELNNLDDLFTAVRSNTQIFDQMGGLSEAFAQMPLSDVGRDIQRTERTDLIVEFLAAHMPSAPEGDAHNIGIVLRHLLSHRSWFWLTREYGLTTEAASDVTTWAIATLLDAANRGDLPTRKADNDD